MKKLLLVLAAISLTSCETLQDLSQTVQDAGVKAEAQLGSQSNRLIATGSCPAIEIVEDLGTLHNFTNTAAPSPETLISVAQITGTKSSCTHGLKSVTMALNLAVQSTLGPKARSGQTFAYPYFVAVTTPTGKILAKEIFTIQLPFEDGETIHTSYADLQQIIPTTGRYKGNDYKVAIGFQTTKTQLDYNRELIRLHELKLKEEQDKLLEQAKAQKAAAKALKQTIQDDATKTLPLDIVPPITTP